MMEKNHGKEKKRCEDDFIQMFHERKMKQCEGT
jgi:hypothetical protein